MKRLNMIFIVTAYLFSISNLTAQPVSRSEAISAAYNFLRYENRSDIANLSTDTVITKIINGNILLYEIRFNNGAIALLSGNKSYQPILGLILPEDDDYSNGILDHYYELPCGLKFFIDNYLEQLNYCFVNNIDNIVYKAMWDSLLIFNNNRNYDTERRVSPLIQTKWGQASSNDGYAYAYNYYVNGIDTDCVNCPAGCVAVAMGQILKYWNEPSLNPSKCIQYDWNNMPNTLVKASNNQYETQRNAIAKLLIDCGHSVNMSYCTDNHCTSGAFTRDVALVLSNYGYNDAIYLAKADYSSETWESMLRSSLDASYPLQYRGDGHSFVCDGYRKTISNDYKYHFNWGWCGNNDGWFSLINLDPDVFSFNSNQAAIFYMYPGNCWQNILFECDKYFANGTSSTYQASNSIQNNGNLFILNNNANVHCIAGNDIVLSNGFYAASGSAFLAEISSCVSERALLANQTDDFESENVNTSYIDNIMAITNPPFELQTNGLLLFPNPTHSTLYFKFDNSHEKISYIDIVEITGVLRKRINFSNLSTIDVSDLSTGIYIIKVYTERGQTYIAKFIKG